MQIPQPMHDEFVLSSVLPLIANLRTSMPTSQ